MRSEVHIFRAGKYPQGEFTVADVAAMVEHYNAMQTSENPEHRKQAPLFFDHPDDNQAKSRRGPAAGYVLALRATPDGNLFAEVEWVPTQVHQISSGAYKNRSVEISRMQDGTWRLNAVAMIGAATPAVGGLEPIDFSRPFKNTEFFAENFPDAQQFGTTTANAATINQQDDQTMTVQAPTPVASPPDGGTTTNQTTPAPAAVVEQFTKHPDAVQMKLDLQNAKALADQLQLQNERLRRENEELAQRQASGLFTEGFAELRRLGIPNSIEGRLYQVFSQIPEKTLHFQENGTEQAFSSRHLFFSVLREIAKNSAIIPEGVMSNVTAQAENTVQFAEAKKKADMEDAEKNKDKPAISDEDLANKIAEMAEEHDSKKPGVAMNYKKFISEIEKSHAITKDQKMAYIGEMKS